MSTLHKKEYISFFNKNIIFDITTGNFEEVDLFSFLENLSTFDYSDIYDDIYYILKYTDDAVLHIISNIKQEIRRGYEIIHISKAKEFDKETDLYIAKKPGISLKDKLQDGKIKAVKRYESLDTYENRLFKKFLKKIVNILENNELNEFEYLYLKIRKFLRSNEAKKINENKKIVFNNILLHHKFYKKIFKAYKWLYLLEEKNKSIQVNKKALFHLEVLKQLQYFSDIPILPAILDINLDKKSIKIKKNLLDIDIEKIYDNDFKLKDIQEVARDTLLEQKIELNKNYRFDKKFREKEVFIDIFRAYPVCLVDDEFIQMPLFLKQKIDNKIVNANNTKIINLDKEFYTLPEILKSYDVDIFRYFIKDLEKYFQNSQINYIVPDYINPFEFSKIKKIFNIYFKTKPIPKSILASLEYLFNDIVEENDTLIYIQKNYNDELFVTPILVKKDEDKKTLNGLYLEKYPTKKFKDDKSILKSLREYFDEKTSNLLLTKFLQNGLKKIFTVKKKSKLKIVKKISKNKQPVFFLYKNKIIKPQNIELQKFHHNKDEMKAIYSYPQLFTNGIEIINDSNKINLINFQKLLKYEKDGFVLWKEHLIKLAMGDIFKDGYFDEFILVDDNSEVLGNEIIIKNNFLLPANQKEVSFPLILGEDSINYEAYIASVEMPFDKDIKCKLKLTYDFEAENPYELTFIPLNNNYKLIKVKWREIEYKNEILQIPTYPQKKGWQDFRKVPKRDGSGYSDLLDWIEERLSWLEFDKVQPYIIEKETNEQLELLKNQREGYFLNGKYDRSGEFFCFVSVKDIGDVFCHSRNFIETIDTNLLSNSTKFYLNVKKNKKGQFVGYNVRVSNNINVNFIKNKIIKKLEYFLINTPLKVKSEKAIRPIKSLRFPLLKVFNEHSLNDEDIPLNFKEKIEKYRAMSVKLIKNEEINFNLKQELLFFLSVLHQDMPKETIEYIKEISKNLDKNLLNIALSLGGCKLDWQKKILQNIINQIETNTDKVVYILSIAIWRDKDFIFLLEKYIDKIIKILAKIDLIDNKKLIKPYAEFLLAILRLREKNPNFLHPKDEITKQFISIVDKITKEIIIKNLEFKSRVEIEFNKPKEFEKNPTLLYALRLYLTGDIKANNIKILGVNND